MSTYLQCNPYLGPKEDAMLLLGVHRHGLGNWKAIQQDKELGLSKKIAADTEDNNTIKLPDGPQLKKRVLMLFNALNGERVHTVRKSKQQRQRSTTPANKTREAVSSVSKKDPRVGKGKEERSQKSTVNPSSKAPPARTNLESTSRAKDMKKITKKEGGADYDNSLLAQVRRMLKVFYHR